MLRSGKAKVKLSPTVDSSNGMDPFIHAHFTTVLRKTINTFESVSSIYKIKKINLTAHGCCEN